MKCAVKDIADVTSYVREKKIHLQMLTKKNKRELVKSRLANIS